MGVLPHKKLHHHYKQKRKSLCCYGLTPLVAVKTNIYKIIITEKQKTKQVKTYVVCYESPHRTSSSSSCLLFVPLVAVAHVQSLNREKKQKQYWLSVQSKPIWPISFYPHAWSTAHILQSHKLDKFCSHFVLIYIFFCTIFTEQSINPLSASTICNQGATPLFL